MQNPLIASFRTLKISNINPGGELFWHVVNEAKYVGLCISGRGRGVFAPFSPFNTHYPTM